MSLPELDSERPRGVLVRKPQTTIYTVLLLIALVALVLSCLLLVLELSHYGFQFKPPANLRTAAIEKGDSHLLCQAPLGPFRQNVAVTFFDSLA